VGEVPGFFLDKGKGRTRTQRQKL